jgi:hypothetical protein
MSLSIIQPGKLGFPEVSDTLLLFFNLRHFHIFRELVKGGRIRSFGPSKRFQWERVSGPVTVLGGMIGAPLAVLIAEAACAAGGRRFYSFGTTGWIGTEIRDIGTLIVPEKGCDETGMIKDYGGSHQEVMFDRYWDTAMVSGIVSVNSFFRLTPSNIDRYRRRNLALIDMEAVPLQFVLNSLGSWYSPLLLISDKVEGNDHWVYDPRSRALAAGLEKGLNLLSTKLAGADPL